MNSAPPQALKNIRRVLSNLETLTAWREGTAPSPQQIYTPWTHGRALDLNRTLVVGNRGVGKSFWSNTLVDPAARAIAAQAYESTGLQRIASAVFGFRGGFADRVSPNKDTLRQVVAAGVRPETLWLAVALRAIGGPAMNGLPERLVPLATQVQDDIEDAQIRLREAAQALADNQQVFLLVFDSLERLGDSWDEIRPLTQGLFRFALNARSLPGLALKIFVRPDQLADTNLQRFPDASKLLAERTDLRWLPSDLYGLLYFHIWNDGPARAELTELAAANGLQIPNTRLLPKAFQRISQQRRIFTILSGAWMGQNRKRGSTFTWVPQHLADARGETSPRSFMKALAVAALHESRTPTQVIDYNGIKEGVVAASQVRVSELLEDYWWISRALQPLAGLIVPCEEDVLIERWRNDRTVEAIQAEAVGSEDRLLPILFETIDARSGSDETALLDTLIEISVIERRQNGKLNFPDIFRIGAGIRRKGGVRPPKRSM